MAKSDVVATTHKERRPKKEVSHVEVHQAENGGHIVKHIHTHYEHPPEDHVFGQNEGHKLVAHLTGLMNINPKGAAAGEEEEGTSTSEKESAEI